MVVAGSAPYAIGLHPEHVFQPNALGREVPDDPDDPSQRIAIRSQSRVRPIAFDLAVAEKIRHQFAHSRLALGIGKPRIVSLDKAHGRKYRHKPRGLGIIFKHKTAELEPDRCMLFVALNRTELRSRNEPIFKSPSVNTHGLLVAAAHRYVRFGGSTPSNPHVSVHLCDVRTDAKFDLVPDAWCPLLRGNCQRNKQLL